MKLFATTRSARRARRMLVLAIAAFSMMGVFSSSAFAYGCKVEGSAPAVSFAFGHASQPYTISNFKIVGSVIWGAGYFQNAAFFVYRGQTTMVPRGSVRCSWWY